MIPLFKALDDRLRTERKYQSFVNYEQCRAGGVETQKVDDIGKEIDQTNCFSVSLPRNMKNYIAYMTTAYITSNINTPNPILIGSNMMYMYNYEKCN